MEELQEGFDFRIILLFRYQENVVLHCFALQGISSIRRSLFKRRMRCRHMECCNTDMLSGCHQASAPVCSVWRILDRGAAGNSGIASQTEAGQVLQREKHQTPTMVVVLYDAPSDGERKLMKTACGRKFGFKFLLAIEIVQSKDN